MSQHYDVIIVGAGMVGATLAAALSEQASLNIALIEAHAPSPLADDDKAELRVSALTHASEMLLKNLAIWPLLKANRISPFSDMKVWETQSSLLHFDCAEIGEAILGNIVENKNLQLASLERCQQQDNIDFLCPAKPISLTENSLVLDNGRTITADLIVAADGAQSPLRDWKDIKSLSKNFRIMSDIVINHASIESKYFKSFIENKTETQNFFIKLKNSFVRISNIVCTWH